MNQGGGSVKRGTDLRVSWYGSNDNLICIDQYT